MVEPNTTADDAEEFKNAWNSHIQQLYKIGHSLPEDEIEEFMAAVEDIEEYVDQAAEHTFEE